MIPEMRKGLWLSEIHRLCNDLITEGVETIAEVGVFSGSATLVFSQYFKMVYAIDPWEAGYDVLDVCSSADMSEAEKFFDITCGLLDNVVKIKATSHEAAKMFREAGTTVDALYLDAEHTYDAVRRDLHMWIPLVDKAISGHDADFNLIGTQGPEFKRDVARAILETLQDAGTTEIPKKYKDTSWMITKKDMI